MYLIPLSVIFNTLFNISIIIGKRSVENEKRKKKRRRKVRMLFQKTKKKLIEVGVKPNLQSRVQMLIIQLKLLMKIQKMKVRPKNILISGKKTDSREKKKRQIRKGKRTES